MKFTKNKFYKANYREGFTIFKYLGKHKSKVFNLHVQVVYSEDMYIKRPYITNWNEKFWGTIYTEMSEVDVLKYLLEG